MARSTNTQFAVAVHVLTYLSGRTDGPPVSSAELSESTRVNAVYVRRVMGPLREAGFVHSHPGVHGGWELAAAPESINLGRVWSLLQGDDPVLGMHGPNPTCAVGRGVQQSLTLLDQGLAGALAAHLGRFSIADVLSGDVAGV